MQEEPTAIHNLPNHHMGQLTWYIVVLKHVCIKHSGPTMISFKRVLLQLQCPKNSADHEDRISKSPQQAGSGPYFRIEREGRRFGEPENILVINGVVCMRSWHVGVWAHDGEDGRRYFLADCLNSSCSYISEMKDIKTSESVAVW